MLKRLNFLLNDECLIGCYTSDGEGVSNNEEFLGGVWNNCNVRWVMDSWWMVIGVTGKASWIVKNWVVMLKQFELWWVVTGVTEKAPWIVENWWVLILLKLWLSDEYLMSSMIGMTEKALSDEFSMNYHRSGRIDQWSFWEVWMYGCACSCWSQRAVATAACDDLIDSLVCSPLVLFRSLVGHVQRLVLRL